MAATYDQLRDALRDTLEAKGVLRDVRARMQAEVFASVNEPDDVRPALNNDKLLLNELICEYLEFSGYRNALSVFLIEAGQPEERLRRDILASQLNLPLPQATISGHESAGAQIPLLYGLLSPNEGTGGGAPPRTRSWQTYGAVEFSSGRARGE
mmetsp:Transcript_28621/g.92442  ORF Transcript_28621/g.92442 Transcript_28621/m.92442 type:complete len:154 (-) Transcript_28621:195-656(-)